MSRHLIIAAAGTGGHVMPGLAVAEEMRRRGWTVTWVGTESGLENKLVPAHGLKLERLRFSGMRGKGPLHFVKGAWRLIGALLASLRLMRRLRPAAVFGTGGYVCLPVGFAAGLLGCPLALLNADAVPLLSNRMLKFFARRVAFGFPGEYDGLSACAVWTGNPVRPDVAALADPEIRYAGRSGRLRVLVVGGSLGATVLNETVPKALGLLAADGRPSVVHQAGERRVEAVRAAYAAADVEAEVLPFIDDIARCYAEADLVICRAGAITVSELCAGGVPAILVPFLASTTGHQEHNARFMAKAGAAIHLPQTEFTPQTLARILAELDRKKLAGMGGLARLLAKPHATRSVADLIEESAS